MIGGLYLIYKFSRTTDDPVKKKQAKIIIVTGMLAVFVGTISDVLLPEWNVYAFPNMANVFVLIWAFGIVYAIAKYKFLIISPASAAEHIISTMSESLMLLDSKGRIVRVNDTGLRLIEYKNDELVGKGLNVLFPTDIKDYETFTTMIGEKSESKYELNIKTKSGGKIPVIFSISMLKSKLGETIGFVCVATDIAERKKFEQKITNASEEWKTTFDSITDLISIVDKNFSIVRVNKAFANTFGYHPTEIIGKKCYELMHGSKEEHPLCPHKRTIKTKTVDYQEFFEPNLGKYLEMTTSPLSTSKGNIIGTVHIAKDITRRRELEQIQRLAQLGKLVADMAHEVNNPLMVVSGRAQLSLMEQIGNEAVKNNLNIIFEQAQRAKTIIERLLKFSKTNKGAYKEVNLNQVIEGVLSLLEHQFQLNNVIIKRNFSHDAPAILIDEKQIQEVVINLLNNSFEAMPEGGVIEVNTYVSEVFVGADFKDTGIGMSDDILSKIYDPFFTTKEKGTGLGLSVCYRIIKDHGGELKFQSSLGQGTNVAMLLPKKNNTNDV
jgi:PAS domain S-box-containing protein